MTIQKVMLAPNLLVVWNDEHTYVPSYTFFLHGRDYTFEGNPLDVASWPKLHDAIQATRNMLARDRTTCLNPNALVTVYCGALTDESLDKLRTKHMREFVLNGLMRIAGSTPRVAGDSVASVKALALYAKMTGTGAAPRRYSRTGQGAAK